MTTPGSTLGGYRIERPLGRGGMGAVFLACPGWRRIRASQHRLALDWLERAYESRNTNLPYISVLPVFHALRDDPRFRALLQRMNLPL